MLGQIFESTVLLFVLLNPFLLAVYLIELMRDLSPDIFYKVMVRAALIAFVVFALSATGGDWFFSDILGVRFAAFQAFGGLLFVIISLRYMLSGGEAIISLRGEPEHLAGSIAMPFMIGPATVSASILAGAQLPVGLAILGILGTMVVTVTTLIILKVVHDRVRVKKAALIERYTEIVGRVGAILLGTIAMDMIFKGLDAWLKIGPSMVERLGGSE